MKRFKCDYCGEDDPGFLQTDGYAIPDPITCPFESESSADWIEIKEEPTNDRY